VYGKIASMTIPWGVISYTYDAMGSRITKTANNKTTIYVRDVSGNVMSIYEKPVGGAIEQTELHIYGSSRIGIRNKLTVPDEIIPLAGGYGNATMSVDTRGETNYELVNHLGNVLATITDKKIPVDNNSDGIIDYYIADIVNVQDYYPGGMLMPGRQFSSTTGYRYGFNGKEKDNEGPVQYDYGFRIYDPRLVRFKSVDPLTKKYPYYSPYQFAGNSPIKFVDIDGLEPGINEPTTNAELKGKEGRMWAVNLAYDLTGGEDKYSASPVTEATGTYATTVDKTKFFANIDRQGLNRTVNENSQFVVTNDNAFKTDKDLVNHMLGNFLWGIGPENYVFPENGKFSTELKGSIAVGETLTQWAKNNYKDDVYGWHMDLRGEINVDANSGFTSLEHFLGSVSVKISKVDEQTIKLEIFNVTSLTSGDFNKDVFGLKALKSTVRDGSTHMQTDHSNISQYFSLTISTSEADKLIKQFNGGDVPVKK
jgi:RHS repeat-associated protein